MENEVNNNSVTPETQNAPVTPGVTNTQDVSSYASPTQSEGIMQNNYGVIPDDTPAKPKKKFPVALLIVIIVLVLGIGGGVVWYIMSSSPKAVFKNVISSTFKEINNAIDEYDKVSEQFDYKDQALLLKGKVKVSSSLFNEGDFKKLGINPEDYTFGVNVGLDPKNQKMLAGASIEGSKSTIAADAYYEDKKLYVISELLDNPIYIDLKDTDTSEIEASFEELEDALDELTKQLDELNISTEDVKYISTALEKAFIDSLDDKKMTKSSGTYEVNGKSVKATKISYEFDRENIKRTVKAICESLANDDKFIKILADMTNVDKSDIKDALSEIKDSANEVDIDKPIYINVYIKGLTNELVGIEFEQNDKKYLTYYENGKDGELTIKIDDENKVVVNITEEKETTTVVGKMNGKEYVKLEINTKDEDAIDFKATITYEDVKAKVGVYFKNKVSKSSIKVDFKLSGEYEGEDASIEGNLEINATDKLTDANLSKAVDFTTLKEADYTKIMEKIEKAVKDDDALSNVLEILEEQVLENTKKSTINDNNNITLTGSKISCKGTDGSLEEEFIINYDDDLDEITAVTVVASVDTSELSASEAAMTNSDTFCTMLQSMDTEIKACSVKTSGTILTASLTYEPSYIEDVLAEEDVELSKEAIKDYLTGLGNVCTIS